MTQLLLIGLLLVHVPLASLVPPDPSSISGLYDDADYDDVILLATWAEYTPGESSLLALESPLVFVHLVSRAGPTRVTNPDARLNRPRGPPSV